MNQINFFKTLTGLFLLLSTILLTAQPPHSFNYQAVLRDADGTILESQEVTLTLEILKGEENGDVVFTEVHSTQTNAFGLVNLAVGSINTMEGIQWDEDVYFLRITVDGQVMGTSPLLSVPFALYAQTSADAFSGDYNDLENTPDLGNMIVVDAPQEGSLAWFDGTQWKGLAPGEEGHVLTIVNGIPAWMALPEDDDDDPPTVTDIDGNTYPVVTINGRTWMAENLRTTRYNNGDLLVTGLNDSQWNNTLQGAYSIYPFELVDGLDSEEEMKLAYGLLYNWHAAVDPRGLCPAGWHVPTDEEWIELISYMTDNYPHINPTNVGNFVKSCRQIDSPLGGDCDTDIHPRWNSHHTQYGTDEFGMAALPAGYRNPSGSYAGISNHGGFWTSTEYSAAAAWRRYTGFGHAFVYRDSQLKRLGTSVRCIKTIQEED